MNVLMIGSHLRVNGGITRVVKNYMEAGLNEKANLTYFPTYYGSNNLVNILYFFTRYLLLYFQLIILRKDYDAAHIHMSYKGSFLRKKVIIALLKKRKIPMVLHMHGSQFKDFYHNSSESQQREIKNTLNSVDVILALGQQWKQFYESISTAKVISLDNAVFPKEEEAVQQEKVYISTMGVLSQRKGSYDLLEVGKRLKGKMDKKYKFLIAGDGDVEIIKKKIKELDLEELFVIPGWISDQAKIEEIYQKSAIYMLPSYNEGMPMSVLEGMSYGIPIISTRVGSIETVVEAENGILVQPGEIDEMVKSITYILDHPDVQTSMSKNNREKINQRFNIYSSIDDLLVIFRDLQTKVGK